MDPASLPSAQWPTFAVAASNPHRLIFPFRTFGPYGKANIGSGIWSGCVAQICTRRSARLRVTVFILVEGPGILT